jgi:molecular chaperone GrpE
MNQQPSPSPEASEPSDPGEHLTEGGESAQHPQPSSDEDPAERLAARVDELEAQVLQMREEQLRERAELDNQRKRMTRDLEQARRFANERLLGDLLPVFDSLERALEAVPAESTAQREGIELTLKQMHKVAEGNGLSVVDPAGAAFNPEHHQAISAQPAEGTPANTVLQVFQKGYLLNSRLLRPALVVVSQGG